MVFPSPSSRIQFGKLRHVQLAKFLQSRTLDRSVRPRLENLEARQVLSVDIHPPLQSLMGSVSQQPVPLVVNLPPQPSDANAVHTTTGPGGHYESAIQPLAFESTDATRARLLSQARVDVYNDSDWIRTTSPRPLDFGLGRLPPDPIGSPDKLPLFVPTPITPIELAGKLTAIQPSQTYQIPVGPDVSGLRLGFWPKLMNSTGGTAFIDEFAIIDETGQKLVEFTRNLDAAHPLNPGQPIYVSFSNLPKNIQFVFRISSTTNVDRSSQTANASENQGQQNLTTTGITSPVASSVFDDLPYLLSVEEFDRSSGTAQPWIPSTELVSSSGSALAFDVSNSKDSTPDQMLSGRGNADESTEYEGDLIASNSGGRATFNTRIPTGPLIGRGSAPMGGILATPATDDDPAPIVDRFDGIVSRYVDGFTSEERHLAENSSEFESGLAQLNESDDPNASLPTVSARLFPSVGSSDPSEEQDLINATELLASLSPLSSTEEVGQADVGDEIEQASLDPSLLSTLHQQLLESRRSRPASWGLAAVCATIGISLTSRPYLPTVLDRLRRLTSKRPRKPSK